MPFKKYMHIERFGNDEVQGIELGRCYVFPKLDGTNASVWCEDALEDGSMVIGAGSRNRSLSLEKDNAGFYRHILDDKERYTSLFYEFPHYRLFGEWLVPHSLKTYRDDAWRKFYVFDVYNDAEGRYMHYDEYQPVLENYCIDYIPPVCIMNNATYDALIPELENNVFLIKEGSGAGEGIVIKNYSYVSRYGRTAWAKIITNKFKEEHARAMPTEKNMKQSVEVEIVESYVTKHLVDKEYAKIVNENDGWNSRYIPQLLGRVFYCLVNEELWNVVKTMKYPTINFKTLNSLTIMKIKNLKPELF